MARTLTQKEVKKRVLEALTSIFSDYFGSPKETRERLKEILLGKEVGEQDILRAAMAHTLYRGIESKLWRSKGRQCTEEELEIVLAQLRAQSREWPSLLRQGVKEMLKKLPRRGGPGKEATLSRAEKQYACEQVTVLLKAGNVTKWRDIFETVAEMFKAKGKEKVSARMIKRAWENRQSLFAG